jgi:hypothetical protein
MVSRFTAANGQALLLEILADETILRGTSNIAGFAAHCELIEVAAGTPLIKQGDTGMLMGRHLRARKRTPSRNDQAGFG